MFFQSKQPKKKPTFSVLVYVQATECGDFYLLGLHKDCAQILSGKTKRRSILISFLMHLSLSRFSMSNVQNVPGSTVVAPFEIYLKSEPK